MFLDLPQELQHEVYDRLDIKHRTKLNVALPRAHRITHTLRTNPTKDAKLKYLTQLTKVRKYKQIDDLSETCIEFIRQNQTDPTVVSFCKTLDYTLQQPPNAPYLPDDIRNNAVSPTHTYAIPSNLTTPAFSSLVAQHATPTTFDNLLQNPSITILTAAILNTQGTVTRLNDFFFNMVNRHNAKLLSYGLNPASPCPVTQEWRTKGADYLDAVAHIFVSLDSIKILCVVIRISDSQKQRLLLSAIEHLNLPVADYLTSIGVTL